jgi:hypothetical protein
METNLKFYQRFLMLRDEIGALQKNAQMKISDNVTRKYVDLPSILKVASPLFIKYNIFFEISHSKENTAFPDSINFDCNIIDAANDCVMITHTYKFPCVQLGVAPTPYSNKMKGVGATQTYAIRYILGCELLLITEEDPDSVLSVSSKENVDQKKEIIKKELSEQQKDQILALINGAKSNEELKKLCNNLRELKNKYIFDLNVFSDKIKDKSLEFNNNNI